jgi:hypothetical protein
MATTSAAPEPISAQAERNAMNVALPDAMPKPERRSPLRDSDVLHS